MYDMLVQEGVKIYGDKSELKSYFRIIFVYPSDVVDFP